MDPACLEQMQSMIQSFSQLNQSIAMYNQLQPVRFHILDTFAAETISFFESCNLDWEKARFGRDRKNKASHLGAYYFGKERLQQHDWFDSNVIMADAEVMIVPFQFTKAEQGQCSESLSKEETYKEIGYAMESIIDLGERIANKPILFIFQHCSWCYPQPLQRVQFSDLFAQLSALNAHIYVGHFENRKNCPWNIESRANTIVLPYTSPISLDQYEEFNKGEQFSIWKERAYSLFFMGSICRSNGNNYYDRALAFKYLDEFTNSFGVVTDANMNNANDLCARCGIYNWSKPCDDDNVDGSKILCLLTDKEVNKDNRLYIGGMKKSKFNLMIHGDTPTSGKFYDSIAFNMINIMVGITEQNKMDYLPFADVIPYQDFLFFIPPKEFKENGIELLKNIIYNTSDAVYENMMSNLTFYKKDILWNMKESVVVKHVLREVVNKEQKRNL